MRRTTLALLAMTLFAWQAHATTIHFTDGLMGTVPGSTITYTITGNQDDTPAIGAGSTHDNEYDWPAAGTAYRKAGGDIMTTITFSKPIPINALTLFAIDFNSGKDVISVSGGTADTHDFTLDLGLFDPMDSTPMMYDPATGELTTSMGGPNFNRHDAHLVGNSTDTVLSVTHTSMGVEMADAVQVEFGFLDGVNVPEPSSLSLLGIAGLAIAGLRRRR